MPAAKQGVRFTPETKDFSESIPLGYAIKARKAKEEKAKFLQEERERRAVEDERKKLDDERRAHEEERRRMEEERKAWEEERRQRKYADDVAAARKRQSMSRGGLASGPSSSSFLPERERPTPERGASTMAVSQSSSRKSFEPAPPRRQASEPTVTTVSSVRGRDASPATSRSPVSPASASSQQQRQSVLYSAAYNSSEDVRSGNVNKRMSMVSASAPGAAGDVSDRGRVRSRKSSTHSNTSAAASGSGRPMSVNMNMFVPPVPPMPMMAGAMYTASPVGGGEALLPPSAPFMMQSYGPRSRNSSRGSRESSDRRSGDSSPARNSTSGSSSGSRRPRQQSYQHQQQHQQHQHHPHPHPHLPSSQSSDRVNTMSGSGSGSRNQHQHQARPGHERRPSAGTLGSDNRSYSFQDPRMSMVMPMNMTVNPMAAQGMANGMPYAAMGMGMGMSTQMSMPVGMNAWGMRMAPPYVGVPQPQPTRTTTPGKSGRQSVIF